MRYLAVAFFAMHGVAHFAGKTPLWMALGLAWGVLAVGTWMRASWWLLALEGLAVLSMGMCVWRWSEAKWGVAASVIALALGFAYLAWPGAPGMALRSTRVEELWQRPGTAARLKMRGEIKLGQWYPFRAEQVLTEAGFVWAATVSVWGVPIVGSDEFVDGKGAMRWKLLGLIPVAVAVGPDVSRSAEGRMKAERAIWLWPWANEHEKEVRFLRWGNPEGKDFREEMFGVSFEETAQFSGRRIPSKIRAGWYHGTPRFEAEGEFFRATIEEAVWK
jgi:hypothetical protein